MINMTFTLKIKETEKLRNMHIVAEINLSNKDDHILSKVNQTQVPRYQR